MGTVWALYGHCTGIVWALGFPIALFMRSSFGVRKEADSKDLLLYSSVGLPSGGEGLLHCCVPGASVTVGGNKNCSALLRSIERLSAKTGVPEQGIK